MVESKAEQEGDNSRETELWGEKDFLLAVTLFASFAVLYELAYVLTLEKLRASSADLRDYFTFTSSYHNYVPVFNVYRHAKEGTWFVK